MPADPSDIRFRGIDTGTADDGLLPGFWAELINVDVFKNNVARPRQGLFKISTSAGLNVEASGFVSATQAYNTFGVFSYFYIDASGNRILHEAPSGNRT